MGKADPEPSKGRKRQLNVIYFIDSARTRSLTLSLGSLNALLVTGSMVLLWSVASAFLIVWLVRGRTDQSVRLHAALATIFEYETRDDKVFDIAYPPTGKNPGEDGGAAPTGIDVAAAKAPAAAGAITAPVTAEEPSASPTADPGAAPPATTAAKDAGAESAVIVGNPVLEASTAALLLRFDLTNKSGADRVEGMVWAIAEFKTDAGERFYIGAPAEISVNDAGEPDFPQKAALFGIRRFKQKSFHFPVPAHKAGTFTSLKIGVMDRAGAHRTTYNVPVQIRAGQSANDDGGAPQADAPKQG